MKVWVIVPVLTLIANTAFADFTGPVVSILDGDTIEVLHNTHPERVRLSGIDCPEKGGISVSLRERCHPRYPRVRQV
jgi:endonuclease YncB( thermonuclease family)